MKISSILDLQKISNKINKILSPGDVILLYGQIGVGKTSFARLLINNYENEKKLKKSEVLSPTFNIVFEYDIKDFTIEHYDLYRLKDEKEIKNIGLFQNLEQKITSRINKILLPGDVIFLYGQIGVGKTTFVRLLINNYENEKKLNNSEVLSPTFNIVFEYDIKDFTIEHYDLYRIKNEKELKNIGLFVNLKKNITIVEWPELIKNKPINRIDLFFEYTKDMNERTLTIKTSGRLKDNEF